MKRFKQLSVLQKAILIGICAMALEFCVLYPVTLARVGYAFRGAILTPAQTDVGTVYSGKVHGEKMCIRDRPMDVSMLCPFFTAHRLPLPPR